MEEVGSSKTHETHEMKNEKTPLPMKRESRSQEWHLCWGLDVAVVLEEKMSDRRTGSCAFVGAENAQWDAGQNLGSWEQAMQSGMDSVVSDQHGTLGAVAGSWTGQEV